MTKYSDEFKIKAVQMVLKDNTVESVTRMLNIPSHSTLDAWLAHYNHGGIHQLLHKNRSYSPDFKQKVLEHCWQHGLSLREMAGIYLISTAESGMQFNLTGDILALSAAAVWALYAVLTRKITTFGYNTILITRHIFFYGLLFMLPALYIFGFTPDLTRFYNPAYLFNILFLGLGASAMCFVTWNYAVKVLGAVKTSAYIYAVPVLTVASAVIVLNEPVTVKMLAGGVLIILGLLLSQKA